MKGIRPLAPYRALISRAVLGFCLIMLAGYAYSVILPFQLGDPKLSKIGYDFTFWIYRLSGWQSFLVGSKMGSLLFTALLFTSGTLGFFFPLKRTFVIIFTLCLFLLHIVFNINLCHGSHLLLTMAIIPLALWPAHNDNFELLWEGMRYYACFVYSSASLWKLINGAFFQSDFGEISFLSNISAIVYNNPDSGWGIFYSFFIQHPFLLNWGDKFIFLMEGLFLIGFFTKKMDGVLILSCMVIFTALCLFAEVVFLEMNGLFILALLPERTWKKGNDFFLRLKKIYFRG